MPAIARNEYVLASHLVVFDCAGVVLGKPTGRSPLKAHVGVGKKIESGVSTRIAH